jgi:lipopolysaccharide/colanic/teichoic acid biosynthesis glycosyltransferase
MEVKSRLALKFYGPGQGDADVGFSPILDNLVNRASVYAWVIRGADIFISLFGILFLMPAFLVIAAAIAVCDGGPVFFTQKRVGRDGKYFVCVKFRTMRTDGDRLLQRYLDANPDEKRQWDEYHKLDRDPRITAVGRFLRKTSLDEFPQLINVLKGEMSLVGPRPILPEEVAKYGSSFRIYKSVLPGITGLWQIKGRNQLSYYKRVALDRLFARKMSLIFYVVILVLTIPAVLLQRGSK